LDRFRYDNRRDPLVHQGRYAITSREKKLSDSPQA
jgi:hypothetical protein